MREDLNFIKNGILLHVTEGMIYELIDFRLGIQSVEFILDL